LRSWGLIYCCLTAGLTSCLTARQLDKPCSSGVSALRVMLLSTGDKNKLCCLHHGSPNHLNEVKVQQCS
jgi:hypothetical protein